MRERVQAGNALIAPQPRRGLVHLVYPYGPSVSCPQAIGRHLAAELRRLGYAVLQHDWQRTYAIRPAPDDVLVGHPHPDPGTVFRRSLKERGWRRAIALAPFNGNQSQLAYADPVVRQVDLFLAITGNYWAQRVPYSAFSHWLPKMRHVDLAVDMLEFPRVKARFNPTSARRVAYIGHSGAIKNTGYLEAIAAQLPEVEWRWYGRGAPIRWFRAMGHLDFASPVALKSIAECDFTITVARADANPATILETMAWGLIPTATVQSGYEGWPGIVPLPLDAAEQAASALKVLLASPEKHLLGIRDANDKALATHFTWARFAADVVAAIETDVSPPVESSLLRQASLKLSAMASPYSMLRPRGVVAAWRRRHPPVVSGQEAASRVGLPAVAEFRFEWGDPGVAPLSFSQHVPATVNPQAWSGEFRARALESIGRRWLPVYRMADGEFTFMVGWLPEGSTTLRGRARDLLWRMGVYDPRGRATMWGERYTEAERRSLAGEFVGDVETISRHGILAIYLDAAGRMRRYVGPVCEWLVRAGVRLGEANYVPFPFVLGVLLGPGHEEFYRSRRILVASGADDRQCERIRETLALLGASDVKFLHLSRNKAMMDRVDVRPFRGGIDVALVAAGIGSARILCQMQELNTLCIDSGALINALANPEHVRPHGWFKLPECCMRRKG